MKYFYGIDKKNSLSISPDQYIGEGNEGIVYHCGGIAAKIINDQSWMTEEKAIHLSLAMDGKLIHLPLDPLYNKNAEYCGYIMKFLQSDKNGVRNLRIVDLPCKRILKSFKILNEDGEDLAEQRIGIYDIKLKNIVINNGMIHVIDADRFPVYFSPQYNLSKPEQFRSWNKKQINKLGYIVYNDMVETAIKDSGNRSDRDLTYYLREEADHAYQNQYMLPYLRRELSYAETPQEYITQKKVYVKQCGII